MSKLKVNEIAPFSNIGIGVGGPSNEPSALVNFQSTNQGLLIVRLTTAQRDAIASPKQGLMIYNTDNVRLEEYDGTSWGPAGRGYSHVKNLLRVVKNSPLDSGDFSSLADALASISDNSVSNPYIIWIGPGIYTEPQIIMKPYVFVVGSGYDAVSIQPQNPSDHLIIGADNSAIYSCELTGVSASGKALVYYSSATGTGQTTFWVEDVRFGSSNTLAIATGTSAMSNISINDCRFGGTHSFTTGFVANTGGLGIGKILVRNSTTSGMQTPYPADVFVADGAGCEIVLNGVQCRSGGLANNCIRLRNSASLRITATNLKGFAKAIWLENVGSGSTISGTAVFENNTMDLVVDDANASGNIFGPVDYQKIYINPSSSVFIPNKDLNIITVAKRGGDFASIASAVSAAASQSPGPSNQFIISVGPGTYVEPKIIMVPWVSIAAQELQSTIIVAQNPNDHAIVGASNSTLSGVIVTGVTGTDKAGYYLNQDGGAKVENSVMSGNYLGMFIEGSTSALEFSCDGVVVTGGFTEGVRFLNSGFQITAAFFNTTIDGSTALSGGKAIFADGSMLLLFSSAVIRGNSNFDGMVVQNGCTMKVLSSEISFCRRAFVTENVGVAPILDVLGLNLGSLNTTDIEINHPGTTGTINGIAAEEKSTFNAGTINILNIFLSDPDGSVINSGSTKTRQPDNTFTDVTTLASQASSMGILSSGDISPPVSGLTVNVEAGYGYLQKSDGSLKKIIWPDTPFNVPADSDLWLYFDSAGSIQSNSVEPDPTENIVLGRVTSSGSTIDIIEESGFLSRHAGNGIGKALRNGLGCIYSFGSIVSEFGTRQLSVTAGRYYFGEREFLAQGGSPITFIAYYRDGSGGFVRVPGQTTMDNAFWDDGSGTLAALGSGNYAKHSVYALGDSSGDFDSEAYFVVYSQAQYTALALAEQGSLPNPPNFLSSAVTLIASIIVQEGHTNIVEVRDERPVIGSNRVSQVSATTFHSNLLGLTVGDDHPQYWRNDGTHVATGDFNLGTHNITNLGTANGVVVENHHARHQPGGADAIPTAAAATLNTDQANAEGTSTSLSRADHIHNVPTDVAVGLGANTANAQGASTKFSRSDHTHSLATGVVATQNADQPNAAGSSNNLARADHVHNIPTAIVGDVGSANAQGTANTFSKSDHTHRGVRSINSDGGTQRFGNIRLNSGNDLNIVDNADGSYTFNVTSQSEDTLKVTYGGSGLSVSYTAGQVRINGVLYVISGSSLTLTANVASGSIYVDVDGVVKSNSSTPPSNSAPLATYTTGPSSVTALTDARVFINNSVAFGSAGDITTIQPDDAASAGSTNRYADAGHKHAIDAAAASTQTPDQANAEGVSTSFARADHTHNIPTGIPSALTPNAGNSQGSASAFARQDHIHNVPTAAPVSQTPDQANADGVAATFSKSDHIHNVPTAAPTTTLSPATTNAQGAAATFARSDHTHAVATALVADITTIQPDATASAGTANNFARGDHRHAIVADPAVTQTPDQSNAEGTSTSFARADHVHNVPTAAATGLNAGSTNTQGAAASFARSDHTHAIASGAASTQTPNQVNAAGTSTNFARADHVHNIPTGTPSSLTPNAGNSQGTAAAFAQQDHIHNVPTAAPANQTIAAAASDGSAATFSRSDHLHTFSTAAASGQTPNQANAAGTSTSFARADHVHNIPTGTPSTLNATNANTQGSAAAFAQQDHLHAISTGAASTQTPDQANATGTSANLARADHVHNIPTAAPVALTGTTNVQGSAASFAKSDHIHAITSVVPVTGQLMYFDGTNWAPSKEKYFEGTVSTTDNTVTTLITLSTASDTSMLVKTEVIGRRTGGTAGAAGDSATYIRYTHIKNVGGTVTVNGTQTEYTDEDQAGWNTTFSVSGTSILVRVQGATNNNISWQGIAKVQVL